MADPATDTPVRLRDMPLPLVQRHTASDSWAVNTYAACDIRCTYCITSQQGRSTPRRPADEVGDRLRLELAIAGTIDRMAVGPFVDVYPGTEAELGVTRVALEVLAELGHTFRLITKGPTVVRDIDVLARPGVNVQISVCMLDPAHVDLYEPGAASPEERIAALHELHAAGVDCIVQATPWIPEITDVVALRRLVDPEITIQVTPLRLPDYLHRAARAFDLTQAEVNEAYRREYERLAATDDHPNVIWSRPPPLDGSAVHVSDNVGRSTLRDWDPAPPAPIVATRWFDT